MSDYNFTITIPEEPRTNLRLSVEGPGTWLQSASNHLGNRTVDEWTIVNALT